MGCIAAPMELLYQNTIVNRNRIEYSSDIKNEGS